MNMRSGLIHGSCLCACTFQALCKSLSIISLGKFALDNQQSASKLICLSLSTRSVLQAVSVGVDGTKTFESYLYCNV